LEKPYHALLTDTVKPMKIYFRPSCSFLRHAGIGPWLLQGRLAGYAVNSYPKIDFGQEWPVTVIFSSVAKEPGESRANELKTQMMRSGDLECIDSAILKDIMGEIYELERMLKTLIKSLENKHLNP
jgi:hypothetical protein